MKKPGVKVSAIIVAAGAGESRRMAAVDLDAADRYVLAVIARAPAEPDEVMGLFMSLELQVERCVRRDRRETVDHYVIAVAAREHEIISVPSAQRIWTCRCEDRRRITVCLEDDRVRRRPAQPPALVMKVLRVRIGPAHYEQGVSGGHRRAGMLQGPPRLPRGCSAAAIAAARCHIVVCSV